MLLLHLLTMFTFRKLYSLTIAATHIVVRIDCRKNAQRNRRKTTKFINLSTKMYIVLILLHLTI